VVCPKTGVSCTGTNVIASAAAAIHAAGVATGIASFISLTESEGRT
jgi:hypothetical protein